MKTLDKEKPYGEICGINKECPRARFEQDGELFDAQGKIIGGQEEEPRIEAGPLVVEAPKEVALEQPAQDPTNPEDLASDMARNGMGKKEIKRRTGLHHSTVARIMREVEDE